MFLIVLVNFTVSHLDAERESTGIPFEAAVGLYPGKDEWLASWCTFSLRDTAGLALHSGLLNHPLPPKIKPRALCRPPLSCALYYFLSQSLTL